MVRLFTGVILAAAGYAAIVVILIKNDPSGAFSAIKNKTQPYFDGQKKKRQALSAEKRERLGRPWLQRRANVASKLKSSADNANTTWLGGKARRGMARAIGGYNVEAQMSGRRAAVAKEVNDQIATGQDGEPRGLSVMMGDADKAWKDEQAAGALKSTYDSNGKLTGQEGSLRRVKDGKVQYKSAGGAWIGKSDVIAAHNRWGDDHFAQQASLSYEMRKASTKEEVDGIKDRYYRLATGKKSEGGWGQSLEQANGTWIGAAFENQGNKLHYKRMSWDGSGTQPNYNGAGQVSEMYENKGSYNTAQLNAASIDVLGDEYKRQGEIVATSTDASKVAVAKNTMTQITAISETMMNDMGGMQPVGAAGALQPVGAGGGGGGRRISVPGSAHTSEAAYRLAHTTGVLKDAPKQVNPAVTLTRMPPAADILADTDKQQ